MMRDLIVKSSATRPSQSFEIRSEITFRLGWPSAASNVPLNEPRRLPSSF